MGAGALRASVQDVLRESCSRVSHPARRGTLGRDPGPERGHSSTGSSGRRSRSAMALNASPSEPPESEPPGSSVGRQDSGLPLRCPDEPEGH